MVDGENKNVSLSDVILNAGRRNIQNKEQNILNIS